MQFFVAVDDGGGEVTDYHPKRAYADREEIGFGSDYEVAWRHELQEAVNGLQKLAEEHIIGNVGSQQHVEKVKKIIIDSVLAEMDRVNSEWVSQLPVARARGPIPPVELADPLTTTIEDMFLSRVKSSAKEKVNRVSKAALKACVKSLENLATDYECASAVRTLLQSCIDKFQRFDKGCLKVLIEISKDEQIANLLTQLQQVSFVFTNGMLKQLEAQLDTMVETHPFGVSIARKVFTVVVHSKIRCRTFCNADGMIKVLEKKTNQLELVVMATPPAVSSLVSTKYQQMAVERFQRFPMTFSTLHQMMGKLRLVQVLRFDESIDPKKIAPHLDAGKLQQIIMDPRCDGLPFFVISLNEDPGSGKSFLVNLLISKFAYQERNQDDDLPWIESGEVVKGVEWRCQQPSVSEGIWVYSHPLVVKTASKQKVVVIVMDCKGFADPNQQAGSAMVTLYSLELSSLQIFSGQEEISPLHLGHFQTAMSSAGVSEPPQMYNTLIFLHRDWTKDKRYGKKGNYFDDMRMSRPLNEAEKIAKSAFQETTEYALPIPGSNIRMGDVSRPMSLQDLKSSKRSAKFLNEVNRFGDFLLEEYATEEGYLFSREELLIMLERMKRNACPEDSSYTFESSAEVLERRKVLKVYEEVEEYVLPRVEKAFEERGYKHNEKDKMLADLKKAENAALEYLRKVQRQCSTDTTIGQETWREIEEKTKMYYEALKQTLTDDEKDSAQKKIIQGLGLLGIAGLGMLVGGVAMGAAAMVSSITGSSSVFSVGGVVLAGTLATGGLGVFFLLQTYEKLIEEGRKAKMLKKKKKKN